MKFIAGIVVGAGAVWLYTDPAQFSMLTDTVSSGVNNVAHAVKQSTESSVLDRIMDIVSNIVE